MPIIRRNRISNLPPAIPDPPSAPTTTDLRATIMQMLQALRNAGLALSPLNFSVAAGGAYTYHSSSNTITAIRDGVTTSGMMVSNSAKVFVQVTFTTPTWLTAACIYVGQFNGAFNMPRNLAIFAGAVTTDTGPSLFTGTLQTIVAMQEFNLSALPAFSTPLSTYTFVFSNSTNGTNISVNEMQLFGVAA